MIGANDGLVCEETTADHCSSELGTVITTVTNNVKTILSTLRNKAHYRGQLAIVNYYDTAQGASTEIGLLNQTIDTAAAPFHVVTADGFGEFAAAAAHSGGNTCTPGCSRSWWGPPPPAGSIRRTRGSRSSRRRWRRRCGSGEDDREADGEAPNLTPQARPFQPGGPPYDLPLVSAAARQILSVGASSSRVPTRRLPRWASACCSCRSCGACTSEDRATTATRTTGGSSGCKPAPGNLFVPVAPPRQRAVIVLRYFLEAPRACRVRRSPPRRAACRATR